MARRRSVDPTVAIPTADEIPTVMVRSGLSAGGRWIRTLGPRGESAAVDEPYTVRRQARSGTPTVYGHAKPLSLDVTATQQDAPSPGDGRSAGGFRGRGSPERTACTFDRRLWLHLTAYRARRGSSAPGQ